MFGRTSKTFTIPRIFTKFNPKSDWKRNEYPTENLRASIAKTDNNNLAFVTTFNPNNKHVFPLIQTVFKSL